MPAELVDEPVQARQLDSFRTIPAEQESVRSVEEHGAQTPRRFINFAAVSLFCIVLAGLVLLGVRYDKFNVGQSKISAWWHEFSTAQRPEEKRSSIPRVIENPKLQLPPESVVEKSAPGSISAFESQSTVEAAPLATAAQEYTKLEQGLPVQEQHRVEGQANPAGTPAETGNLSTEASVNSAVPDTVKAADYYNASLVEKVMNTEEPVPARMLPGTLPPDENGVVDPGLAGKTPAAEYVLQVEFGFDSAELLADSKSVLDQALALMNSEPGSFALIVGYSDSLGAEQYNLSLSRRRAVKVGRYLMDNGIQRARLQVEGRGAIQDVENAGPQESLSQNRDQRIVEIRIDFPGQS